MALRRKFSDQDLDRIKEAVRSAEQDISGEIVPVFVQQSDNYLVSLYRAGALGSLIVFVLIIVVDRYFPLWGITDPLMILLVVLLAGLIGAIKAQFIPFIRRMLIGQRVFDRMTRKRAESAFLGEEVFNTRQRTGIMIFVSFFEREVIVLADKGISSKVDQEVWDLMVSDIIEKFRDGNVTEGMVRAVTRCGEILLEHGFVKTPDDINELKDDLRSPGNEM